MIRNLTESQHTDPHRTCSHCGFCLVWVTTRGHGKQNRRLSCLLCKARKAIKILCNELDELNKTPVVGFTQEKGEELERRYLDGEDLIDLINELGDRTTAKCGESKSLIGPVAKKDLPQCSLAPTNPYLSDLMSVL